MNNTYLAIERGGKCIEHIIVKDGNDIAMFEDVMNMSYNEIKNYNNIDEFVVCIMDATNKHFETNDGQTIVTLVEENGVFVWSIIMGPGEENGSINYAFVDWKKDGKSYRYEV